MQRGDWLNKIYIEVFLNEFLKSLLFGYWKRVYRTNQRLSIFFQIDLEVIKIMRSEYFSLGYAENICEFVILKGNIRKVRSLCKFCRVGLNVWRAKTELKLARAWKFWYAQEYHSTNDSDVRLLRGRHGGLRYRYGNCGIQWLVSRDDGDANGVLATTQERVRFSCKDR